MATSSLAPAGQIKGLAETRCANRLGISGTCSSAVANVRAPWPHDGFAPCSNVTFARRQRVGLLVQLDDKALYASSAMISGRWRISERASAVCSGSGLTTAPHSSQTVNATNVLIASSRSAPDCRG